MFVSGNNNTQSSLVYEAVPKDYKQGVERF